MPRLPGIRRVFRLDRRADIEREVQAELEFHLETRVDDLVRGGRRPDEARRLALAEFGDVTRYRTETSRIDHAQARATRWHELLQSVASDVRFSLRGLRKSPGFAAAAVLTLALGIGANTAVWTIIDALLRRPLPIARPEALHVVAPSDGGDGESYQHSYPRFARMRALLPDSQRLAALSAVSGLYATSGDQPEPVAAQLVSGNWFGLLGVRAAIGRVLGPGDDVEDGATVTVLSHGYWQRRFGGAADVVGTTLRVNGVAVRIIGVAPPEFQGLTVGQSVDLWLPLHAQGPLHFFANMSATDAHPDRPWMPQEGMSWLTLIARVAPGEVARVTGILDGQLRSELAQQAARADASDREQMLREHLVLQAVPRGFSGVRDRYRDPLRVLTASVALVLLVACANLAGLLLARGAARQHELAVRASLGAPRARLVRQVLTDAMTIALLAGAVSVVIARWGTAALVSAASSSQRLPVDAASGIRIALFTVVVSLVTGLAVGLLPAYRVSRASLYDAFRQSGRVVGAGARGAHRLPLGRLLVVLQIAMSLVLVAMAGMFVRTLVHLLAIDPGYERTHVVEARITPRAGGYEADRLPDLYDRLVARVGAIPGVRSASLAVHGIAGSQSTSLFAVPGRTYADGQNRAQHNYVTPGYFRTLGIGLVDGRAFTAADRAGAPKVAIVNESAARRLFGTTQAVGARFGYADSAEFAVVGVVRDARVNNLREAPPPFVYFPLAQGHDEYVNSLEVRAIGSTDAVVSATRAAIRDVDPMLPVREIVTVADLLERGLGRERLVARLAGTFGVLALVLAAIGLYGVMGHSVARRTSEMGVRLALGASPGGLRSLVLRESLGVTVAGLVLGLGLLVPAERLTSHLIYGMSPRDPVSVAGATVVLLIASAVAAFVPAWRASRIDPVEAIRSA